MSANEKKPILQDSGIYIKPHGSGWANQVDQQHLIIQPIEFDHKHRNCYGYLALAAALLVLINYLLIKERSCIWSLTHGNYDLIQGFHITLLIITIVLFILSYFNVAVVIYEFRILFYASTAIIFICVGLLIYNSVAISSAPCVPIEGAQGLLSLFDASAILNDAENIFVAADGIGITVFIFDLLAAIIMLLTGLSFYRRC